MRTDINQALECWASRPTWFTSHSSDTRELTKAVANLRRLTPQPTQSELGTAIYHRVKDLPDLLGTPSDIKQAANDFAAKIFKRL